MESILTYSPWLLKIKGRVETCKGGSGKQHGKGLIAKLAGVDDREMARTYNGIDIAIEI